MTDTQLDRIDAEIALGRKQVLSAFACGDTFDAEIYEHHVDELLDARRQLTHGPVVSGRPTRRTSASSAVADAVTPLLSQLIHTLRLDRCHARFYLGGPRCRDVRGHTGKHYVFSGFAQVHWF